ncbi:MAG: MerR family transcriptional regulator, partial [Acidobacteriota bacterium]|nr:MerR family transcriptional regulator [Acidobacteriota bacterium]
MTGRPYLSIGDVLTLLRQEFPDVTISKIRFLESQGLVNPERTPSGYRKFYEPDVDRLRWVLRQQREHFLPLKVIKGRLDEGGGGQGNGNAHDEPSTHPSAGRSGQGPRAVPAPAAVRVGGG